MALGAPTAAANRRAMRGSAQFLHHAVSDLGAPSPQTRPRPPPVTLGPQDGRAAAASRVTTPACRSGFPLQIRPRPPLVAGPSPRVASWRVDRFILFRWLWHFAAATCTWGPLTQRRHRAVRAKIGAKPPLNRNPESATVLWVTLGITGITPYCKSRFLEYRRRKSVIQHILQSHRTAGALRALGRPLPLQKPLVPPGGRGLTFAAIAPTPLCGS